LKKVLHFCSQTNFHAKGHINRVPQDTGQQCRGEREAGTKYRSPAVRTDTWSPNMLLILLSFSVQSLSVGCTN
jgi:hypothetical protein